MKNSQSFPIFSWIHSPHPPCGTLRFTYSFYKINYLYSALNVAAAAWGQTQSLSSGDVWRRDGMFLLFLSLSNVTESFFGEWEWQREANKQSRQKHTKMSDKSDKMNDSIQTKRKKYTYIYTLYPDIHLNLWWKSYVYVSCEADPFSRNVSSCTLISSFVKLGIHSLIVWIKRAWLMMQSAFRSFCASCQRTAGG